MREYNLKRFRGIPPPKVKFKGVLYRKVMLTIMRLDT